MEGAASGAISLVPREPLVAGKEDPLLRLRGGVYHNLEREESRGGGLLY